MRFGILGPLEVAEYGDRPLELGGRKQRAVLAILLLHTNEVVSSDRLVADLWSGRPPASAAASLQAHVSRLRRALGSDQRIVTTGGGYLLRVAPGELDRERFERLVEEGSAAISREDWELASAKLREALGLWRELHRRDARFPQLIANYETVRIVGGSAVVADQLGVTRWHELGYDPAPTRRPRGAFADRLTRAGQQVVEHYPSR